MLEIKAIAENDRVMHDAISWMPSKVVHLKWPAVNIFAYDVNPQGEDNVTAPRPAKQPANIPDCPCLLRCSMWDLFRAIQRRSKLVPINQLQVIPWSLSTAWAMSLILFVTSSLFCTAAIG